MVIFVEVVDSGRQQQEGKCKENFWFVFQVREPPGIPFYTA